VYYIGMDLHLRRSSLEALDQQGGPLRRIEFKEPWPELLEKFGGIPLVIHGAPPRPYRLAHLPVRAL